MNLASFVDFVVNVFGLCIVVGLIFMALDSPYIQLDAWIKRFAKFAVGGAAVLAFIIYCASVFVGGAGAAVMHATPASIIEFAIGMILLIAVLYIISLAVAWLLGGGGFPVVAGQPPTVPVGLASLIIFLVNIIGIVVI